MWRERPLLLVRVLLLQVVLAAAGAAAADRLSFLVLPRWRRPPRAVLLVAPPPSSSPPAWRLPARWPTGGHDSTWGSAAGGGPQSAVSRRAVGAAAAVKGPPSCEKCHRLCGEREESTVHYRRLNVATMYCMRCMRRRNKLGKKVGRKYWQNFAAGS